MRSCLTQRTSFCKKNTTTNKLHVNNLEVSCKRYSMLNKMIVDDDIWFKSNDHVYIDHWTWPVRISSKWRNRFTRRYGSVTERLRLYENWFEAQPQLLAAIPELNNKVLGCWCIEKPIDYVRKNKVCHREVLLELLTKWSVIHDDD
jgi:hypothetical protein